MACSVVRALWCVCGVVRVVCSVLRVARVGLRGVCTVSCGVWCGVLQCRIIWNILESVINVLIWEFSPSTESVRGAVLKYQRTKYVDVTPFTRVLLLVKCSTRKNAERNDSNF